MYAQIYVDHALEKDHPFTYQVPINLISKIQIGSLVIVPFRNRMIRGIVCSLSRQAKYSRGPLKKVASVMAPSIITDYQRQLARWLSEFYGASISQSLFMMIPDFGKSLFSSHSISRELTEFNQRLKQLPLQKFLVIPSWEKRFSTYRTLLKQKPVLGKQILILLPELLHIKRYKMFYPEAILYGNQLSIAEKKSIWQAIMIGESLTIIGTRSALFLPFTNLKLIICDQPFHPGFFEDRMPRYAAWQVALKLAMLTNSGLLFGDEVARPIFKKISDYQWSSAGTDPTIVIHQVSTLNQSIEQIVEVIKKRRPAENLLVVVPKKGDVAGFRCLDCGGRSIKAIIKCPQCDGTKFKPFGFGVESLMRIFKKYRLDRLTQIIDSTRVAQPKEKIVVATQQIFDFDTQFDFSMVVAIDCRLDNPDPLAQEDVYSLITRVRERTKSRMTILVKNQQHQVFSKLAEPRLALANFLDIRRQINAYPYGRIFKLTTKQPLGQAEIKKLQRDPSVLSVNKIFSSRHKVDYYKTIVIAKKRFTGNKIRETIVGIKKMRLDVDPLTLL